MITRISLKNFILVESCDFSLQPHFTALTGETGAGKTALIEALALALGERADTSLIRSGCDRAIVEISFDISMLPHIPPLLDAVGIVLDPGLELTIRREITLEGKNRAFINCQATSLPLLKQIGESIVELVSQ